MKIGLLTVPFHDLPLLDALNYFKQVGFEAVELYTGELMKPLHCDPDTLLNNEYELKKLKDDLEKHDVTISQLNCSGNAISPVENDAEKHQRAFKKTVLLAEKLNVDTIGTFSGCPGGGPDDKTPNWITCPWPEEFLGMHNYQWEEVLIPYWKQASAFASDHGVTKIAIEMHPGFCVYNPETLLRLRSEVGNTIGANFDPSHLFWQGIDIPQAIMTLGEAIFHVHAKDTRLYDVNIKRNGVLDTKHYGRIAERAWVFGTIGYGHGEEEWRRIIDALTLINYDYVISIEHEDSLKSKKEGLEKGFKFISKIITREKPEKMWWA